MNKVQAGWYLLRHQGPAWLACRAGYAVRRRSGLLRRASPAIAWEQVPAPELELSPRTSLPSMDPAWGNACVGEAEDILHGKFRMFSNQTVTAGFPPDWHKNQMTENRGRTVVACSQPGVGPQFSLSEIEAEKTEDGGQMSDVRRRSSEVHWSEISSFGGGDIKGVWELSRFPWSYALVRASARTGDGRFAMAFWQLFADWCRFNPPNLGPNWMCGQEAAFRLMAVVFAAENMGVPRKHRAAVAGFVVATGRRIAANLDYALSQRNNHGVSECVGLIIAALLAPEHDESAGWLALGLSKLQAQCSELIYEDGGFAQHSLIYHRVLLHNLCWCRWRLRLTGKESPEWLNAAGVRALDYLLALTDPATGQAPLYGANDGANVLPLSDSEFLDMRPVIQLASALFREELPLPAGPWDEAVFWLVPDRTALRRTTWPRPPERWHAREGGCFQLRAGRERLFMRCPTGFRHRPSQADMLHVDVWHEGRPVAHDGGSFSYNSAERFVAFGAAAHHNVLTVDGREPLQKFSRFLYLPWPKGEAGEAGDGVFRASHDGYAKLGIRWTREVLRHVAGNGFTVRDKVRGAAGHRLAWHWRLADLSWQQEANGIGVRSPGFNYKITWAGPANTRSRLLRADGATAYGWWSPCYGSVEPAAALLLEVEADGDIEFLMEFCPL